MSFKPGDAVIVISVPGVIYPHDAVPGTIATIVRCCECLCSRSSRSPYYEIQVPARTLCAVELVLKKIDPDGRQLTRWEECAWEPALPVSSV
jgi:hypothetical protein